MRYYYLAVLALVTGSLNAQSIILPSGVTVQPGQQTAFPVNLSSPAPAGGAFIILLSNNTSIATVSPSAIFISQGATSGIPVHVTGVSAGTASISAGAYNLTGDTKTVVVGSTGPVTLSFSPQSVTASPGTQNVHLALSGNAPAGALAVNLSSDNPAVAQVQPVTNFTPDGTSPSLNLISFTAVAPGTTVIHASALPGIADTTLAVTVLGQGPPPPGTIILPAGIVLAPGQSAIFPVALSAPAPAGGVTVSLTSSSSNVSIPPSVVIAAGSVTPIFQPLVNGVTVGSAVISAFAQGYTPANQTVQVGASLSFSPASLAIAIGGTSNLQLNLSVPAPAGGITVTLASSNSGAVSVPGTVTFAANSTGVSVPVTGVAAGSATITASASNVTGGSANVTVNSGRDILLPSGIALAPGDQLRIAVTLANPAPLGGVFVTLLSSDPSKVTINPAAVFISAGALTSPVQPQLTAIAAGSSSISAGAYGLTGDTEVVLVGTAQSLLPTNLTIMGTGTTQNLTLTLSSGAPAGGVTFNLSSSNPSVATVPASVTVSGGNSSASVPVTSVSPGSAVIDSSSLPAYGHVTANVTVVNTGSIGLPAGVSVPLGQSVAFAVTLGAPAPSSGVTVALSSSDPSKVSISPSSVLISAGNTTPSSQPQVTGLNFGSATINATAPNYVPASQAVQVSGSLIFSPGNLTLSAGSTQTLNLNLPVPAPAALTVSLSSTNPGVATAPGSVTFASGAMTAPISVTGVSAGSASIIASAPNVPNAVASITVTGGGAMGAISLPANVQLAPNQPAPFPVTLSTPAPAGGVTVTLTSSDPSVTVTSSVSVAAGAVMPTTQPQINGVGFGTSTITATAPGYTPASQPVQVGAALSFAPASLTVSSAGTSNLQLNLSAPAPASGFTVNLGSSNTNAFKVPSSVTFAANATSVNVPVTGVAQGTASITASASAPNVTGATANAVFNGGADIILPTGLTLMPGDQLRITVTLGQPAPAGGVFLTLASSDTSKLTVSPDSILVLQGATTSTVQPQLTAVNFGTVTLSASASGLTTDSETVRIGSSSGFSPTSLTLGVGATQNLVLSLTGPAPAGGVTVTLSSTNTGVATVPATIAFAVNVISMNVPITGVAAGSTIIHASGPGLADTTANVTVTTTPMITLPANVSVPISQSVPFPVTLSAPAPSGGVFITLVSGNPAAISISPAIILIQGGATAPTTQPQLTGIDVGNVAISASASGFATVSQNVQGTATVSFSPSAITFPSAGTQSVFLTLSGQAPGGNFGGRCSPSGPGPCGITVGLSSDNPSVAQVQPTAGFFPDGSTPVIDRILINAVGPGTTVIHAGAPPFIPDSILTVTVNGPGGGQPPVANAGPAQTVAVGATVQLSGTGTDPQGLPLTFQWSLTKPAGSAAALSSSTIANPTFVADKFGAYTATLIVNDGTLSSSPSSVTVTTQRPKPIANAGPNQNVNVGSTVTLDGSGSSSVDNSPLTYSFTLTGIPNGSNANLSNGNTVSPSFVADMAGTYTARLTVNDGTLTSDPAFVTITVGARQAASIAATAGTPQNVTVNQPLCTPLSATVKDSNGALVSGVTVTFTAPNNGASGSFASGVSATAVTDASGIATAPAFIANGATGAYTVTASVPNVAPSAMFQLTNAAAAPPTITATSGTPQSVSVNSVFAALSATVQSSGCANNTGGLTVTFTAPTSGPSGTFTGGATTVTALTNILGVATAPGFTANSTGGNFTVTATVPGSSSSANFLLGNVSGPPPTGISFSSVSVGQNLEAIVSVNVATQAGVQVAVSSSDPSKLLLSGRPGDPGQGSLPVTIGAGQTSGVFYVQGLASGGTVTLTATGSDGTGGTGTVALTPSGFTLSGPNGSGQNFMTNVGVTTTLTVTSVRLDSSLNPVEPQLLSPGAPATVPVMAGDPNIGSVNPISVTFPANQNTVATQFTASGVGNTTLTATVPPGFSTPAGNANVLNVNVGGLGLNAGSVAVGQNLEATANVTLIGLSPNDLSVKLTSSDPSKVLFSTVPDVAGSGVLTLTVPAGRSRTQDFYVQALGGSGTVTYTATTDAGTGFGSSTGTVTLTPSEILIAGPLGIGATSFTTFLGAGPSQITIYSVQLNPSPTQQPIRGGLSATVNVTSSDTSKGTITTSPLTIGPGGSSAGTLFQPMALGISSLSVSAAGFNASAPVTANVQQQGMNVTGQVTIGKNLEVIGTVILGQAAPTAGLPVTLTSMDPNLKLSTSINGVGSSSIMVTVSANNVSAQYYLQGFASSGSASYTATAPGFQATSGTVSFGPSGVIIAGPLGGNFPLPFTTQLGGGPVPMTVSTAVLDASGNFISTQSLAGPAGLTVSLSDSASAVGTVPAQVTIAGGSDTANLQFTPKATGSAAISVQTPNGYTAVQPPGYTSVAINVQ